MSMHDKLNYMIGLTLLCWGYVAAFAFGFWLAGMFDFRATAAALAAVTIAAVLYADRSTDERAS